MEEVIYSWCTFFSKKKEFSALIALVEEGLLEELFIAEVLESEIAGHKTEDAKAISFSFSKDKNILEKLENISKSFSLDEIEDHFFEKNGEEFILKGVNYPKSEEQEERIINKLL